MHRKALVHCRRARRSGHRASTSACSSAPDCSTNGGTAHGGSTRCGRKALEPARAVLVDLWPDALARLNQVVEQAKRQK